MIIFAASIGWTGPVNLFLEKLGQDDFSIAVATVSLLIGVWSLYLIRTYSRKKPVDKLALLNRTDFGQVHFTFEAIDDFIGKAAMSIKGVHEIKSNIKSLPEGLALLLKVTINPDVNVPAVTEEIQKKVTEYIENFTGIKVLEVEVVIEKIRQKVKSRVD